MAVCGCGLEQNLKFVPAFIVAFAKEFEEKAEKTKQP
jgi:hypothetical protein